jgi:hypothetical protein
LNNVSLTLALLDGTLARAAPAGLDAAALARCRRYVDTLKGETSRLVDWTRASGAAITATLAGEESDNLAAVLVRTQRMLRHHATLHEASIASEPVDPALATVAEPGPVHTALLLALYAVVELAEPGSAVAVAAEEEDGAVVLRFDVRAAQPLDEARRAFERMVVTPASPMLELVAARRSVESQHGSMTLVATGERDARVAIALPRRTS